jgi:hypothetical protein
VDAEDICSGFDALGGLVEAQNVWSGTERRLVVILGGRMGELTLEAGTRFSCLSVPVVGEQDREYLGGWLP